MSEQELILKELAQTRQEMAELKRLLMAMTGKGEKPATDRKSKVNKYRDLRSQTQLKKNL